jgi:type IV pilus assembly protein PilB
MVSEKKLGRVLVEEAMISQEDLDRAFEYQARTGGSLKNALLSLNLLSEEEIIAALVSHFQLNFLRLKDYIIEEDALRFVPKEKAMQYKLIPISCTDNLLSIAMANPLDVPTIDEMKMLTGCDILPVIAKESEIDEAIAKYYGHSFAIEKADSQAGAPSTLEMEGTGEEAAPEFEKVEEEEVEVDDAPAIKIANFLLHDAVEEGASDIHIEPRMDGLGVRYRLDGVLIDQKPIPRHFQNSTISRFKIMANMDIAERRIPQDGRVKLRAPGGKIVDLRVSSLPTVYGEKVVLRILDKTKLNLDLDTLGFEEQPLSVFKQAIRAPNGIILVTGPTGSGKSTTLYAVLHALNKPEVNIVTVEDPVEYEMHRINQVHVNVDAGLTFAKALRAILRQDPNIVMIGEIRDLETLEIASRAAMTGHLVLSTLHTNDAASTVIRMTDMGCEPFLIASSVIMISGQRLMRTLCDNCKEPHSYPPEFLDRIRVPEYRDKQFLRAKGCSECKNRGYKGRIAVMEALTIDDAIRDMIIRKATASEIHNFSVKNQGMKALHENALSKASQGITSLEEVFRVTG